MGVMGLDLGWWIRWNGGVTTDAVPARTRIGHVHLKVADLERALDLGALLAAGVG